MPAQIISRQFPGWGHKQAHSPRNHHLLCTIRLKSSNFFTIGHQQVRYIMAVDDSKSTMEEIIRSISKNLGTGKIKYISKEDALLEKELSQTAFDMLNVNLRLESTFVKEGMFFYFLRNPAPLCLSELFLQKDWCQNLSDFDDECRPPSQMFEE